VSKDVGCRPVHADAVSDYERTYAVVCPRFAVHTPYYDVLYVSARGHTLVHGRRQCNAASAGPTRELVLSTRRREARRPAVKMALGRRGHVSAPRRVHFSCRTQYGRVAIVISSSRDRESELPLGACAAEWRNFRWHADAETKRIMTWCGSR